MQVNVFITRIRAAAEQAACAGPRAECKRSKHLQHLHRRTPCVPSDSGPTASGQIEVI
jgi:hypothetical protein